MSDPTGSFEGIEKLKHLSTVKDIDSTILSKLNFSLEEIKSNGLHIFGVGKLGQKLNKFFKHHRIPVLGYVDNNKNLHGKMLADVEINSPGVLKKSDIVYIASETYLNPIHKQITELGVNKTLSHLYGSIVFKSYADFPADAYLRGLTEDLIDNKDQHLKVFSLLYDNDSRIVYDNLIHYRLSGDLQYIDNIAQPTELEYFDKMVIAPNPLEVFFDCGGFDGDSAQHFIKFASGNYRSIHIFEPDQELLEKARKKLAEYSNIFYNKLGVFNRTATLSFNSTGGLDGTIRDDGNVTIQTIALDEYELSASPTYIKLDIEGVEIEALSGAKNIIQKTSPRLAVASYHVPNHLWEIPVHVITMNPHYRLVLRHYSNYMLGSTFYFLPTGSSRNPQ